MARYEVFKAPAGKGFVLDIQSDLLDKLNTRVVVPLLPRSIAPKPADRLNPVLLIKDKECVMVTQFMSAVPISVLGISVAKIDNAHAEITAAIDMLTQGF